MTLGARTAALLDLVAQDRAAQCDAIGAQAAAQADELLARARRQSREHAREALAEERRRARAALEAAQAELATQRRAHAQRRLEALLALGWQRLPEVLRERWRRADTRSAWVQGVLGRARATLPGAAWTLTSAPDWPAAERERCLQQIAREPGRTAQWQPDARIDAGLRVSCGGNVVDATLAGLLADRDEIGGRLVGLLDAGEEAR
ncbi:MAG TPA: hypothetical protein VFQ16_04035 [Burkholderiaceae bacterium]|nr:hypothetical protein [Burkholderiaceae bacterium]